MKKQITECIREEEKKKKHHTKATQLLKDTKNNVRFSLHRVWLRLLAKPGYGLEKTRGSDQSKQFSSFFNLRFRASDGADPRQPLQAVRAVTKTCHTVGTTR